MKNMNAEVIGGVKEHTLEYSTSSKLCKSVFKQSCEGRDGDAGIVLTNNNSEVDNSQHRGSSDLRVQNIVYVMNMRGHPLMPTTQQKANKLLKQDKAKVVKRSPFVIQLKYPTGETRQPITLGIDSGYKYVGFSAITENKELISGEVMLRSNIPKKLSEKRMYRRDRRNRLWYRKPRFLNRKRKEGWLAPSIQHKLDSHIRLITKIKEILPISKIIIEVASFDIQKIKNPDIEGEEYQDVVMKGFWNVREYVLHRDNHTCQHCKGKLGDKVLQVHHIKGRKEGATNRPEELITLCKGCHKNYHRGKINIDVKPIKNFKSETFMTTVRWKIVNSLKCNWTYGYVTKCNRIKLGLEKSHTNDAFVIAGGNVHDRSIPFSVKQVRRNNRKLQRNRKGYGISIRRKRYKIQPNDLVRFDGKKYRSGGVFSYGKWIILIDANEKRFNSNIKNVELIQYGKGMQFA